MLVPRTLKESINFERNLDPKDSLNIGKNSLAVKTQIFNKLRQDGVRFNLTWDQTNENETKVIENIYAIQDMVNMLYECGVEKEKMSLFHPDSINFEIIQIIDGNLVILECINKEDANIIMDVIRKFSINDYDNLKTGEGTNSIRFTENNERFLTNLKNNREKFKNFL